MVNEKDNILEVRLNAIIRLLSDLLSVKNDITKTAIYTSLIDVGLTPKEIGNIFGKNGADISSSLSKKKKSKKNKKKSKKDEKK